MRFTEADIDQMMTELRATHAALAASASELEELTTTVQSKDRVLSATVDAHGVLTELKLTGQTWRDLSQKELGAKIVDLVADAQREAHEKSTALLAGLAPEGTDPTTGLPSAVDLESMLQGLIANVEEPNHVR